MKIGLVGPSYQEVSLPFDAQRSINMYPVLDPQGLETASMYGTPGLELFDEVGSGPVRGCFCASNGRAFVVSGSEFYEIDSAGISTLRGTLLQSQGIVSIAENGFQLAICDGATLFIFTYATNAYAQVSDPDFPGAGTVTFIDGYFVVNKPNTGQFYISALFDGLSWNALDFATAESSPDNLVRVFAALGQLFLMGDETTEIWTNTGDSAFPFQRFSSTKMEVGAMAPHAVVTVNKDLLWVGQDRFGKGIVYRAQGFSPQRISTSPIEYILQQATTPHEMRGFAYQENGHVFYIITGGGLTTSLCYDLTTQQWHERAYLNEFGEYEQHLGSCMMFAFDKQLVGDRRNGNVYEMSSEFYSDNGEALSAERIYTHLGDERQRIRYNNLEIGVETGVGLQSGQGSDPQISLQLSKDGARTWSTWYSTSMGRAGKFHTQVTFRRLGIAEQMTFKIRITDPVKRCITGSYLNT